MFCFLFLNSYGQISYIKTWENYELDNGKIFLLIIFIDPSNLSELVIALESIDS
jgi:hypothetical protein